MATATFSILFEDLEGDAQEELCKLFRTTPKDENWETQPLAFISREMED